jgi:hypothetical protein
LRAAILLLGIYCMQIMHMCTVRTLERSLNVRRPMMLADAMLGASAAAPRIHLRPTTYHPSLRPSQGSKPAPRAMRAAPNRAAAAAPSSGVNFLFRDSRGRTSRNGQHRFSLPGGGIPAPWPTGQTRATRGAPITRRPFCASFRGVKAAAELRTRRAVTTHEAPA